MIAKKKVLVAAVMVPAVFLTGCGAEGGNEKKLILNQADGMIELMDTVFDAKVEWDKGNIDKASKMYTDKANKIGKKMVAESCKSDYEADDFADDPEKVFSDRSFDKMSEDELKKKIKETRKTVKQRRKAMGKTVKEAKFTKKDEEHALVESDLTSFKQMFGKSSIDFKKVDGKWKMCDSTDAFEYMYDGTPLAGSLK